MSLSLKSPGWANPFAWKKKEPKSPEQQSLASNRPTPNTKNVAAENPFRDKTTSGNSINAVVNQSDISLVSAEQNSSWEKFAQASADSKLDPATMMLIQTEFKNVSPEERKKWFEELRQVPPAMIPQILRMRRLTQKSLADETTQKQTTPEKQTRFKMNLSDSSPSPRENRPPISEYAQRTQPSQSSVPGQLNAPGYTTENVIATGFGNPSVAHDAPSKNLEPSPSIPPFGGLQYQDNLQYREALDQFISLAEQRVASLPQTDDEKQQQQYIASHAYLRMLYLIANRQERALESIPNIPPADQEFWQQMFWAMSNYFDVEGIPNSTDRATHTLSQLTEALDRLRQRAHLELRNVHFCTKIDGFGIYDRFERAEFRPAQPVLIYAEVRNFLSAPTSEGKYKTVLKSTIEIHRAGNQGGLISKQEFPPTEDFCNNRRNDYFHSYLLNIPKDLPAGPYVLKLIVEDQLNRKIASYMVNFTIN